MVLSSIHELITYKGVFLMVGDVKQEFRGPLTENFEYQIPAF